RRGYGVRFLVNMISREYKRCCFHGIEEKLVRLQAELVGVPLVQKEVTADMKEYEKEFKEAVSAIKGIEAMVFGDIYLDEHKDWVERVCTDIGLRAIEPLWHESTTDLMEEFVGLGFKAMIVSGQADKFDADFMGRIIDRPLIKELAGKGICPCGENGEFHTFVIDGPIFKRRIEIIKSEPVLKEGFWKHWFLDIKKYR
ncbi:MAG: diphthine--ammonia ligase, partial [Candidatus Omnitrophica bacterium]|nr:diphthine--ammonia ligase [Candidatus Omnitrophota bacterium]